MRRAIGIFLVIQVGLASITIVLYIVAQTVSSILFSSPGSVGIRFQNTV